MRTVVNIHEAKTHLSRLVERAAQGHEFVIAKAGRPLVRVVAIEPPPATRPLGFMAGQGDVSLELKSGFEEEVNALFPGPACG